jgi:ABC-type glycerol-3-phosphate transport system permease component
MLNLRREKKAIAWILALISVLPILFIVWLSILNAEDIQQFVFFPQKRSDKATFFVPQEKDNTEIIATNLGYVYDSNGKEILNINSAATVYAQSNASLWAFSANRGLIEIDMKNKNEKNSYGWDFFKSSYENFDIYKFLVSSDILPEHFAWLANNLNSTPALPNEYENITVSSLVGIKFYPSEEIIGQLNWILTNSKALNSILSYWKKWDGWLNPQIYNLIKIKNPSEKEEHLLFRFCLSELFPNKISRLRYFPWQDIWVSQIAGSGLSVLAAENKVAMGIRGEFFPGIAIFDTETKQISWITEATGLPSTSIQNIVQISNHDILAVHDVGFSIIQFGSGKIIRNFMFGEYGLPYLDGQNLYIKTLPNNKISINYGTRNVTFDFNKLQTELAQEQTLVSSLVSSYYENKDGFKWIGYSDGKLEVLNDSNIQVKTQVIPKGKRTLQWNNYQDIIKIMPIAPFLKNSILLSISISLLCTLLAILPSYAIARLRFFGKAALARIMLSSQVLSSLPFLIPVFVIFIILQMRYFQLFNNFLAIILVNTAFFLPLTVQFMFNMFKAIPPNIEESAMIDGCTSFKTFWKIIIPVILPALVICQIYIFLFAWDEILFIWILSTDASSATLPVGIRLTVGQLANRPELLMAFSVIASLPPILLFYIVQPFVCTVIIYMLRDPLIYFPVDHLTTRSAYAQHLTFKNRASYT